MRLKNRFSLFCIKSSTSYHTGDVMKTYYINLSSIENKNEDISDMIQNEEMKLFNSSSFILFLIIVQNAGFVFDIIRVKVLNKRYSFIYQSVECFD